MEGNQATASDAKMPRELLFILKSDQVHTTRVKTEIILHQEKKTNI